MGRVGTQRRRTGFRPARAATVAIVVTAAIASTAIASTAIATARSAPASAVGPGIPVRTALRYDGDGPVLVRAFLVVHGRRSVMCDRRVRLRRDPCAGATMRVTGLTVDERERLAPVSGRRGWTYSPTRVQLLGSVRGRVLRVSPRSMA